MTSIRPHIKAMLDPALHAAVDELHPLAYGEPPAPHHDLPAHVRAASAIRRLQRHLVIVQDDVNAFAIFDPEDGDVFPVMLPRGPGERRTFDDIIGNKRHKMDLEALALLPDERLVAFGSGASAPRESLAVLSRREPPFVRDGAELYRSLRAQSAFAGSQLNIEGAVVAGGRLLLFQRGNGAVSAGRAPNNAIATIDLETFVRWLDSRGPLPPLLDVTPFDLGEIGGSPLGFTDAALARDGRIAVIACAEDSADALTDGPVLGCRFGWLEPGGALRMTDVIEDGRPTRLKLEGIEGRPDTTGEFDVVADGDDPLAPSLLGRLAVRE
ncbi:MAG: hypothetical protein JXB36_03545 [Gammaproteobacteria bacterium]|nr:hypothetical protein [Gammaproteobacteria bacterium]